MDGAGDAVKEEELLVGKVPVCGDQPFDEVVPYADGDIIGQEVAFAGIGMV